MLPFRVDRREQQRTHQKNAAKPYLPHFPLATKLPSERKLTNLNRQIPDRLSDRLWRRDFSDVHARNMACLTQKNEPVLTKWAPTSNRFWVKNRCYTKQTTKPGLTGTRTRIRLSPNFTKTGQNFAAVESQNSELSLWNPLWNPLKKTGRLLPNDRPLLPGSAQNIENDVTSTKQTTEDFLPGATTAHSRSPNFTKIAQVSERKIAQAEMHHTILFYRGVHSGDWLGGLDSNQDKQIQNLLYCQLYDLPTRRRAKKRGRRHDPELLYRAKASSSTVHPTSPDRGSTA